MANSTINFTINIDGNAFTGIAQLDKALGNVLVSAKKTQSWFGKLSETIGTNAIRLDSFIGVVDKVSQGFQSLVGTSLNFEQQQANLKTLLNGDADATANLVNQIREYGKATVYDRSGLVEAQKTMMAFGLESQFAFSKLKQIGDIALGDSQKMQSLSLAFSQATSTGKLMGQDLLQMINAGFNPLEVISQKTGKSMARLKDEMSKGQISAEQLAQALTWATDEGGRFYKGAESAAQTTAGRIAKMKDTIDGWKVSLFEATGGATAYIAEVSAMLVPLAKLTPLFKGVGASIIWAGKQWKGFVGIIAPGVGTILAKLKTLRFSTIVSGMAFKGFGKLCQGVCRKIGFAIMNIPIIGWIAAIISLIITGISALWKRSEKFRRFLFGTVAAITAIIRNIGKVLSAIFGTIWRIAKETYQKVADGLRRFLDGAVDVCSSIGGFFSDLWQGVVDTFSPAFQWIADKLSVFVGWVHDNVVTPIGDAFTWLWRQISAGFKWISDNIKSFFSWIGRQWNKMFPETKMESVSDAYKEGANRGSESWRKSGDDKTDEISILGNNSSPKATPRQLDLTSGKLGSAAGTGAGKAQQINITLDSMVKNMNFNGGMRENAHEVESQLREMMARILGMAVTAV